MGRVPRTWRRVVDDGSCNTSNPFDQGSFAISQVHDDGVAHGWILAYESCGYWPAVGRLSGSAVVAPGRAEGATTRSC